MSPSDAGPSPSLSAGTLAGHGTFRCDRCGYVVTRGGAETAIGPCPGCGAEAFVRASMYAPGRFARDEDAVEAPERDLVALAREQLQDDGTYLAFADGDDVRVVALDGEWTRIGRSLAADIRFDDPTVSRRHALLVRRPDGVRVLDDRSLNGVFVNGERVEWRALRDGDVVTVGRYELHVLVRAGDRAIASS